MAFIVTCPLHAVCNILSLNEAEQLIRKLTRPIVETTRLIEQNLQLAKEYAKDISENPELAHQGLPQKNATSDHLRYPTTICTNRKCCRTVILIKQFLSCLVGICSKCGCLWNDHQHITYEVKTDIRYLKEASSASDIATQIKNLKEEKIKIEEVYKKLAKYLHANAILPLHDDIIEYFRLCIKQEQMRKACGDQNNEVIQGLEHLMEEYKEEINLFK
ncbi:unnamed protein product, partial [Rotaria sp. Silwood2]